MLRFPPNGTLHEMQKTQMRPTPCASLDASNGAGFDFSGMLNVTEN